MSIPLDRLYHYINKIATNIEENVLIYRFWPHGSKKLKNLEPLLPTKSWRENVSNFSVICHDQEPLNYGLRHVDGKDTLEITTNNAVGKILTSLSLLNLDAHNLHRWDTIYNKECLVHSEKRSTHVTKYQNHHCVTVYYWSHAVIARDWFRYAKYVVQQKQVNKIFLIYNRAWSGTREYRLKFAELLISSQLYSYCKTTVNSIEPELNVHYKLYKFENSAWSPRAILENYFPTNNVCSNYSADFDLGDYESTDIEVVLETLFDDTRLHLTEKSLRPIACSQPFILAGTHGSLEYLRSYGFKTFGDIWDEQYDTIEDPQRRMYAIIDLMQQIASWSPEKRANKMAQAQYIADYNRQHFFSQEFFDLISNELKDNLTNALNTMKNECSTNIFVDRWKHRLTFDQVCHVLSNPEPGQDVSIPTIDQVNLLLDTLKNLD